MGAELFELEMLGDVFERRYRKMRPEVEAMPWGTLDLGATSSESLVSARRGWTAAAYQEHRTGVACCAALRALMEARAPLDLIALATRFPLDEMVHVELCARMAMECGGGTEIVHDPDVMITDADESLSPLMRATDMVVRFFCVGEALSIPLLRGTWKAARHPLPRAVLGRIVRDEAAHGTFGFAFLDWAGSRLDEKDLAYLGRGVDRHHRFRACDVGSNPKDPRDAPVGRRRARVDAQRGLPGARGSLDARQGGASTRGTRHSALSEGTQGSVIAPSASSWTGGRPRSPGSTENQPRAKRICPAPCATSATRESVATRPQ